MRLTNIKCFGEKCRVPVHALPPAIVISSTRTLVYSTIAHNTCTILVHIPILFPHNCQYIGVSMMLTSCFFLLSQARGSLSLQLSVYSKLQVETRASFVILLVQIIASTEISDNVLTPTRKAVDTYGKIKKRLYFPFSPYQCYFILTFNSHL